MPEVGEIRDATEIGKAYHGKYMWVRCIDCGQYRWSAVICGKSRRDICYPCSRKRMKQRTLTRVFNPSPPVLGEIRKGIEAGFAKSPTTSYIWSNCVDCGKERWVPIRLKDSKIIRIRCILCASILRYRTNFISKKFLGKDGYVLVTLPLNDFFYLMCRKGGRLLEHRLVMAKHLGRCLQPWETVHHKNGKRDDNRIENLELSNFNEHSKAHTKGYRDGFLQGYIDGQRKWNNRYKPHKQKSDGKISI